MENIKVLIVEDKLLIAEDIATRLKKHSLQVAGMCTSGEEAIHLAQSLKPDLILMDIELSGAMDGISAAQIILQEQLIPIIYLSEFSDPKIIDRAKKTLPANYLTKPFQEPDLIRAIDIAFTNANAKSKTVSHPLHKNHIFLRAENQVYVKIDVNDILYLDAGRAYCEVITDLKTHLISSSMKDVHEQINHEDFVKVHRSHVVNVNRITSLDGNIIRIGNHEVQMSKDYRENLMSLLKIIK